jgi:hypothetical protein
MYSPGVYFARLVDLILENTPVFGVRVIEATCSAEWRAAAGVIAWLTEGTVAAYGAEAADPDRRRQMGAAFVFSRIQGANA